MLYKIQNKEVAISTENRLIPPSRFTRNMHNLSFQIPNSNRDYRKFSFFPHTIRDWNSLQPDIVSAGVRYQLLVLLIFVELLTITV